MKKEVFVTLKLRSTGTGTYGRLDECCSHSRPILTNFLLRRIMDITVTIFFSWKRRAPTLLFFETLLLQFNKQLSELMVRGLPLLVFLIGSVVVTNSKLLRLGTFKKGPHYPHFKCGDVVLHNGTQVGSDVNDYFAVIDAPKFTIVAERWNVIASAPICMNEVYLNFGPDGKGSYAPQQTKVDAHADFNFTVGPVDPAVKHYDMFFRGESFCDYTVFMEKFSIVC